MSSIKFYELNRTNELTQVLERHFPEQTKEELIYKARSVMHNLQGYKISVLKITINQRESWIYLD